jgi:hypothetical protein
MCEKVSFSFNLESTNKVQEKRGKSSFESLGDDRNLLPWRGESHLRRDITNKI